MTVRIIIAVICLAAAVSNAADIEMDANNVSHQFSGFGAQVWSGDTRIGSILETLKVKYVRMKFGGTWTPPTDATQAEMDAYVASQYDNNTGIRSTYVMLNQYNIAVIANFFQCPTAWLDGSNHLKSANFDDIARLWGSIAYYMQNNNMPITYIEIFNEPEGEWDIYVSGANYNTVVKLVRAELNSRGLTNVGITGPGLAYLLNGPSWINALDSNGKNALAAWSTHAWDEGWGHTDALPSFLDDRWNASFGPAVNNADPCHIKPIIVTEYATGARIYNGVTFSDTNAPDSNQFAERCYENTLTLLNNGANILSYWQAADHDWMEDGQSGLMRRQNLGSTLRPVYYAFTTLLPYIPDNAMVLRKTWDDPNISAAGFIKDNNLVLAFANSSADTMNRTVKINGVTSFAVASAQAFDAGAIINKTSEVNFDYSSRTLSVSLPRESTLTVTAVVNECSLTLAGDLTGDCKVDFADYRKVAADWLRNNQTVGQGETLENFESYSDSNALVNKWVPLAGTTTLTLDSSIVHSGGKSMKYQYNNGNSPYYARALHWVAGSGIGVDWTSYDTLSLWFKCTAKKEPLQVNVVNKNGISVLQAVYGTPQVGDWAKWDIDLSSIPANELSQIGRVDIFFTANYYGSGTTYFDDITVVDSDITECSGQIEGDATKDCIVNFNDIRLLSENWLNCTLIEQAGCW